ncbi:MAG: DUF3592 domain-containing protein [Rariglobus sp.]
MILARIGTLGIIYLGVVGSVLGVMGLVIFYRRLSLFISGIRTTGLFVRWEKRGLRRPYYYAVITFSAQDGRDYTVISGAGSSAMKQRRTYAVVYPEQRPEKAMVYSFIDYWAAPLGFFVLAGGAIFVVFQR